MPSCIWVNEYRAFGAIFLLHLHGTFSAYIVAYHSQKILKFEKPIKEVRRIPHVNMYTKSTPVCFVLSHSPTWAPKTLRAVGQDDSARGDGDDNDELFTFLDLQLPVHFNLAIHDARSKWPRGLRRLSAAARLLGLWVRITPEA